MKKKILVVDDSPFILKMNALSKNNFSTFNF